MLGCWSAAASDGCSAEGVFLPEQLRSFKINSPRERSLVVSSLVNKGAIQHFHTGRSDVQGTVFVGILLWLLQYVVELPPPC